MTNLSIPNLNLRCKFDGEHGYFPNGVKLRQHYDQDHAGQYTPGPGTRRVTCELCLTNISRAGWLSHVDKMHGGRRLEISFLDDGGASATHKERGSNVKLAVPVERAPRHHDEKGKLRGECTQCGVSTLRKNIVGHVRDVHGIHPEWGQGIRYWREVGSNVVAIAPPSLHHPSMQRQQDHVVPDAVELEPLTADTIVIGAIETLAYPGSSVPVASLAALFLWRDQTAAMLASVTGAAQ